MSGPRYVRAVWDFSGLYPVIRYTVDGLPPPRAAQIGRLLSGDRRQRKRAARLLRQEMAFVMARPATVIITDEIDHYQKGDENAR